MMATETTNVYGLVGKTLGDVTLQIHKIANEDESTRVSSVSWNIRADGMYEAILVTTTTRERSNHGEPEEADLTVERVQERVQAIAAIRHDPEYAHSEEDQLRAAVLEAIAAGAPHAAELAREALATSAIDFPRWCA